jgi:DOMON domain
MTSGKRPFSTGKTMNFPFCFSSSYTPPKLDDSQDVRNITGTYENGKTTLSFLRKRVTKDSEQASSELGRVSSLAFFWRETTARSGRKG